jgi:hypothetical protein
MRKKPIVKLNCRKNRGHSAQRPTARDASCYGKTGRVQVSTIQNAFCCAVFQDHVKKLSSCASPFRFSSQSCCSSLSSISPRRAKRLFRMLKLALLQPLPADIWRGCPALRLAQRIGDLLIGKALLPHRSPLRNGGLPKPTLVQFQSA